ncbi:DUF721 domain-containing protein [Planctomycetota bacterium]
MSSRRGPERIGDILRDFLETSGLAHKLKHLEVYRAWEEAVGPEIAAQTRIAGFTRHKLYVEVKSAARRHELSTFYKRQILDALREHLPNVRIQDIVFRPFSGHRT